MYTIYVDQKIYASSEYDGSELLDGVVTQEANKASSFVFTVPVDHPRYDDIYLYKSIIRVVQNGVTIFYGQAKECDVDFYKNRTYTCEGALSFFNDTVQLPHGFNAGSTVYDIMSYFVNAHNGYIEERKRIYLGNIDAAVPDGAETALESTLAAILNNTVAKCGGYINIRESSGLLNVDYIANPSTQNSQQIRIGRNLFDLVENTEAQDICTVCIPLGAKSGSMFVGTHTESRMNIVLVNPTAWLENAAGIAVFGKIWKYVIFDDIRDPATLKSAAQTWLADQVAQNITISATVFDLGMAFEEFEKFKLLDNVKVISEPHGIDAWFLITKLSYDLINPENNKITLGQNLRKDITLQVVAAENQAVYATNSQASTSIRVISANENDLVIKSGNINRVELTKTGLIFRDSSGNITKTYPNT